MRIILMIMADIFVAVTAVIAAYEFFGLKRYDSFTVPYTDKMISLGIIEADHREALLKKEKFDHILGIALATLCAFMLSRFIAKWSGAIVYIVVFAALSFLLHPDMTETPATRSGYFKAHRNEMDIRKYHDFLVSVGDSKPDDPTVI